MPLSKQRKPDSILPDAPPAPRHSIRLKVIAAVIVLVSLSTGLCGYLTSELARSALRHAQDRSVALLATTAAQSVARELETRQIGQLSQFIDGMVLDPRVAFVSIAGPDTEPISRRILDEHSWAIYSGQLDQLQSERRGLASRTIRLNTPDRADLIVRTEPIWTELPDSQAAANDDKAEQAIVFHGYLTLALRDPAAGQMHEHLVAMTLGVVCLICLLWLPVIVWLVSRWTGPLRRMVEATRALAAGRSPDRLAAVSNDEIGVLAQSFNTMASHLVMARTALERTNERLEQMVADRTAQLELANKRLEADMREKDQFIRAVTHDLNAPLRNISGMTGMLLKKYESQLTDDALNKLQRIAANARAETELLNDLLELSRITSRPGRRQAVDLNELVESVHQSLAYEMESHGIIFEVQGDLPTVYVNRNRMRQVVQNLVDNAVKYIDDQRPEKRITVGCAREGEPEARVDQSAEPGMADHDPPPLCLFVRDTGAGIAMEDQSRIFQVFQRARYSGTTEVPGRGVGLASVKTIVEYYGGRIWVQSSRGRGTTFYFTLGPACFDPSMDGFDDEMRSEPAPDAAVHRG
jgi:signal transduction histidine kinase